MGPTSANVQPARFVFCLSQDSREKLASVASEANAAKIRKAPAAVVVGLDMDFPERMPEVFPHNPDAKHWFSGALLETTAFRNSILQGASFSVAARAIALDVGPLSGVDNARADEPFFAGKALKSPLIATFGNTKQEHN